MGLIHAWSHATCWFVWSFRGGHIYFQFKKVQRLFFQVLCVSSRLLKCSQLFTCKFYIKWGCLLKLQPSGLHSHKAFFGWHCMCEILQCWVRTQVACFLRQTFILFYDSTNFVYGLWLMDMRAVFYFLTFPNSPAEAFLCLSLSDQRTSFLLRLYFSLKALCHCVLLGHRHIAHCSAFRIMLSIASFSADSPVAW